MQVRKASMIKKVAFQLNHMSVEETKDCKLTCRKAV